MNIKNKTFWVIAIISIIVAISVIVLHLVDQEVFQELGILDFINSKNIIFVLKLIVVVVGAIIADRLVRRGIQKYSKKIELPEHVENIFKLIARIIIFGITLFIIFSIFKIDTGVILSVSALSGAAIGFAATQTVGNFLAGLYLMIARPFTVSDYVKIGDVEGQIKEITVNYTKIYTPTHNLIAIPNRQVLDSRILNYSKKDIVDYTFRIGFPPVLPNGITNDELIQNCIAPVIDSFYKKHRAIFVKKPELTIAIDFPGYMGSVGLDRLQRTFAVRVFFKEKNVRAFYDLQPQFLNEIIKKWDEYRKKLSNHA